MPGYAATRFARFIAAALLLVLLALLAWGAAATTFVCEFKESCNGTDVGLLRAENYSGGHNNAHAQLMNFSGDAYAYTLCCDTDAAHALDNDCTHENATTILYAFNASGNHVQEPSVADYTKSICMALSPGGLTCQYVNTTCGAGTSPLLSLSSSEPNGGIGNQTNAHVANHTWYTLNVCCTTGNTAPYDPTPEINTTDGTNDEDQDLNCFDLISDPDGDAMNVTVKWYKDDVLNRTVEYNGSNASGSVFVATLTSGNTTKDDVWHCGIRLFDGEYASSWVNSSAITITGCNPPAKAADGHWNVDGTEVCRDTTIDIGGNLNVDAGDSLIFDNVTFSLDLTSANSQYDIVINNGGAFTVDNESVLKEYDNSHYYYLYNYDNFTMKNSSVYDNDVYYVYINTDSITRIDDSTLYYVQYQGTSADMEINDSYATTFYVNAISGVQLTIDGLNEDLASITNTITSSNTGSEIRMTGLDVGANGFVVTNDGGSLLVNNSILYYLAHYPDPDDNTTVENTTFNSFRYNNDVNTVAIDGFSPAYTRDTTSNLTKTLSSVNADNNIRFENVGLTTFYMYTSGSGVSTLANSIPYYLYTFTGGWSNTTNATVYYLYCYSGSPTMYFDNVTVTGRGMFYNDCTAHIRASSLESSQYTQVYDTATINFTAPFTRVDDINLLGAAETPTIHGYVNFTDPTDDWAAGSRLNRYFPFNVTDSAGNPLSGRTVSIEEAGSEVASGVTADDGIVVLNLSRDDNALYGGGSDPDNAAASKYEVFLDGGYQRNISMLTSTAYGIRLSNSPPDVPTLLYPINGNETVEERNISFDWEDSSDPESHAVTYTFNLTQAVCVDTYEEDVDDSNYTSDELCVDRIYWWKVMACDPYECSGWSELWNFTIASVEGLSFDVNETDFGELNLSLSDDTTDGDPAPFLVNNTGNVKLNVTFRAMDPLFDAEALGNESFQFKAREYEAGAYASGQESWENVTGSQLPLFTDLHYYATHDAAYVDIRVAVPPTEPAGQRQSTVNITGSYTP